MKRIYKLFLVTVGSLLFCMSVSSMNNIYAKASKVSYAKRFPNELNGTWYTYTNFGYGKKKMYKQVISSKEMKFHAYRKHKLYFSNHLTKKQQKDLYKTSGWSYIRIFKINGYKWFNFMGWQQSAGDGTSFNIHYFNGHKILTSAEGAENLVDAHYYQSKHLAKKLGQKKYQGFKYQPNL